VGNREVHLRLSLHYFHYDQIYGSVGAVVAVLTWSYVSSLICSSARNSPPSSTTSILHRDRHGCKSRISITSFRRSDRADTAGRT
jgi:hypothetical protein